MRCQAGAKLISCTPLYDTPTLGGSLQTTPTRHGFQAIHTGVPLGYTGTRGPSTVPNLTSVHQHPRIVTAALQKECAAGRILGRLSSGVGVVPKKNREVVYDPSPLCHSGLQYQRLHSQGRVLAPLFHSRRHHWISVENRCGGTNGKEISSLLSVWCQCAERIGSYYAFTGRITTISTPGSGLPHASLTNTQWLSTGYCKQTMTCITSSIT